MPNFYTPLAIVRAFTRSTSGNVAIIFALCLPVLVGAAGLGVETSYWYYRSLQLQSAADAAAYSGELENLAGSSAVLVRDAAANVASLNGYEVAAGSSIIVYSPPKTGPNVKAKAVEVILEQSLPRYFTAIFSNEPVVLSARAVAKSEITSKACILALNATASKGALFSGSSNLKLTGCSVMSNSDAIDAVKVQGATHLEVDCLISVGGVELGSGAVMTSCKTPITYTHSAPDPFAELPTPDPTSPCRSAKGATLQPGTYCSGLTLAGTVELNPGVYIVESGDFRINAKAIVSGTGVMVYLRCGSRVTMNGTASVNLSAATSGAYSGILFFGDRNCEGGSNTFNGTATSQLTGAFYFAKQDVNYLGNFSGSGGCSQVVAGTVQWSGNTSIKQDCTSLGMRDIPAVQPVRLVE